MTVSLIDIDPQNGRSFLKICYLWGENWYKLQTWWCVFIQVDWWANFPGFLWHGVDMIGINISSWLLLTQLWTPWVSVYFFAFCYCQSALVENNYLRSKLIDRDTILHVFNYVHRNEKKLFSTRWPNGIFCFTAKFAYKELIRTLKICSL